MGKAINLQGRYRILDEAYLRERSNRKDDPRHVFYEAMLSNNNYAGYLASVGQKEVTVQSYKDGPISGRMEILYARRNKKIGDVI